MRTLTDISFWGGNPNFDKMAEEADATIMRAGQNTWIDPVFKDNQISSRGKLPRGSYWFYDSRSKPANQAALFKEALGDDTMELPLFCDFEEMYGGAYAGWEKWIVFMEELHRLLPEKTLIVYSRYYYWRDNTPSQIFSPLAYKKFMDFFGKYDFWLAAYNDRPPEDQSVPKPFENNFILHQYTERGDGELYGLDPYIKRAIDLSHFVGTEEQWVDFSGGDVEIPTVCYDPFVGLDVFETELYTNEDINPERAPHTPIYRTPSEEDIRKIYLDAGVLLQATDGIPEFRRVPDDSECGFKVVPNWTTLDEKERLNSNYVWVFPQTIDGKTFPEEFNPEGNPWDGGYLNRKYIKTTQPPVENVSGRTLYGMTLRTSPEVLSDNSIGGIWQGSSISGVLTSNNSIDTWLGLVDVFVAVKYGGVDIIADNRVVSSSGVTIRTLPSTLSNKIGAIWSGSMVSGELLTAEPNGDQWLRLTNVYIAANYGGTEYISFEDTVTPPIPPIEEDAKYIAKVVTLFGVNIRKEPTTSSDVVGKLSHNTVFDGYELDGDWMRIYDGWVATKWLGLTLVTYYVIGDTEWLPDLDRPEELFYARHIGYSRIPAYKDANSDERVYYSQEDERSVIFLGDEISGDYLHAILANGDEMNGWIDITETGMVHSQIPDNVLDSLIPQKTKDSEIKRYVSPPETGMYMYIPHMNTKEWNTPQPDTVVLWKDNVERPGWVRVTPEWTWFFFDLLKMDNPGQSITYYVMAYASLYADNRFWTDLHDKDEHRDDILGLHPDRENYWVKWSITTRGNIVEVVNRSGDDVILGGLDLSQPPPPVEDVHGKPQYVHYATQQYPDILSNGLPKVPHFPTIKAMVNGKMEKIGTSFPKFASPHAVSIRNTGMVFAENGEDYPVVNLSRWL